MLGDLFTHPRIDMPEIGPEATSVNFIVACIRNGGRDAEEPQISYQIVLEISYQRSARHPMSPFHTKRDRLIGLFVK